MADSDRKPASSFTREILAAAAQVLPFHDLTDFERARRGLLLEPTESAVLGRFGHNVWNLDDYRFEDAEGSETVHPSLWRQAQLNNIAGLFEVVPGVYQVRGLDISNVTFIRGVRGWIVLDPLTGSETARAAYDLVIAEFGDLPITAVIYTHSHTDHFGGILGVVSEESVRSGAVPVIAPSGFMEAAVSENVIAGTAMLRRATYMYGVLLPKDERGHVDTGLGKSLPAMPTVWLVAPTVEIVAKEETHVIDGVSITFQLTPGTEAPAEMNVYLPDLRALCLAENCTMNLHNLYTLRGAQIRDGLTWSKYIQECFEQYAAEVDVTFASHHWPRFGADDIRSFLLNQRDLYRYIHDETMRLANHGFTASEIAETIKLPVHLYREFYNRDYYGTVRHNAKAVYQRYLGWFDGNPANLDPHPPEAVGQRYVKALGGPTNLMRVAREAFAEGDYRWVVELVNHLVFADATHEEARLLQADALEQLGYQSESGPWRDFYLTGAQELRNGGTILKGVKGNAMGPAFVKAMGLDMLIDVLAVRLNGPAAQGLWGSVRVSLTDRDEGGTIDVRGGVLAFTNTVSDAATASLRLPHESFAAFCGGNTTLEELISLSDVEIHGREFLEQFEGSLDVFEFGFEIVLP